MLTILRSKNFWSVFFFSLFYWLLAPIIPRPYVFDIVNAMSIGGLLGVAVMVYASVSKKCGSWLWPFWNNLSGAHYFLIGLLGMVGYIMVRHIYTGTWRWLGKPAWMIDSLILGYFVWGTVIISIMYLLSRDMEAGQIPRENWRWAGIFIAVGVALALISIVFLDPTPVADVRLR